MCDEVADNLVYYGHPGVEPARCAADCCATTRTGGKFRICIHGGQQMVEHLLIGQFQLPKVLPAGIIIQPDMRDDEALIVFMLRLSLNVHTHDATDELDIR